MLERKIVKNNRMFVKLIKVSNFKFSTSSTFLVLTCFFLTYFEAIPLKILLTCIFDLFTSNILKTSVFPCLDIGVRCAVDVHCL